MIKGTRKIDSDRLVSFVAGYIETYGWPPSQREIAEHFGVSVATAHASINEAKAAGMIAVPERTPPGQSRALRVTSEGMKHIQPSVTQFGGGR